MTARMYGDIFADELGVELKLSQQGILILNPPFFAASCRTSKWVASYSQRFDSV